MKADQLTKARNPLLPAAMNAILRAALRARRDAMMTHTGIVIAQAGKVVRIEASQVRESPSGYDVSDKPAGHEGDS